MSDMPWFKFFPSDWLGGTRGLSALEAGVYINLLATMYERGEPLPFEPTKLARMCGATVAQFKSAIETLTSDGKIVCDDGRLWNERVEKELSERAERSSTAQKSADERWKKNRNKNNGTHDALASEAHSECNASQKPEARSQKDTDDASAGARKDLPDRMIEAAGNAVDPTRYQIMDTSRSSVWVAAGCDPDLDILPTIQRIAASMGPMSVKSWGYFDGPVMDAMRQRTKPLPTASPASGEPRKPFVQKLYGMNSDGDGSRDQNANSRTDAALLDRAAGDGRGQPGISDQRVSGLVQTALRRGA